MDVQKISHKRLNLMFVGFATLLALILGFVNLGSKGYWFDEIFSIWIARDFNVMWNYLILKEANMWLYYNLLYFWEKGGDAEAYTRSLSVILGALSVPVMFLLGKELFDNKVARISALLLPLNLMFVYYAQQTRGYSLLLLLSLLSSLFFVKAIERGSKKSWILYTLVSPLGIYTHLYGGLIIMAQQFSAIFLKIKKIPVRLLVLSDTLIFILLLPLILAPSFHGDQINWLSKPKLTSLAGVFIIMAGDLRPLVLLYAGLIMWLIVKLGKLLFEWKYLFVFSYLLVPVLISFLFSEFVKPIYFSVYFIIILPPLIMLAALGLSIIRQRTVFLGVLILMVVLSSYRLYGWYSGSKQIGWVIQNKTEHWDLASNYLLQNSKPSDGVIFFPYFRIEPAQFYLEKYSAQSGYLMPQLVELSPSEYHKGGGDRLKDPEVAKLASLSKDYQRIWWMVDFHELTILGRDRQQQLIDRSVKKDFNVVDAKDFEEITILLLERK